MPSSGKPSDMVQEISQGLRPNGRSWERCKRCRLGVQGCSSEGTWSRGQCKCAQCRRVLCTGFKPGGYPCVWPTRREAAVAAGVSLCPHLGEASETALFFLRHFSPPLLFS